MNEPKRHPEPVELSTALIAGLALQASELTVAAEHLREAFRFSRQLKVIVVGFVVLIVGLIVVALLNLSNGRAIRSCTTPTGVCYQRNQAATQAAVEQIVAGVNAHTDLVLLATLQCTRHPLSDLEFAACLRAKGIR